MTDFNYVAPRHDEIDRRLREWSSWVKVHPSKIQPSPMFRLYRNKRQDETDPYIPIQINTLAAHEIERAVSILPHKHRDAIRWAYVYSKYMSITKIRQELGMTIDGLAELIHGARDMLVNRLAQHGPGPCAYRDVCSHDCHGCKIRA